jgi:hypothetical protein
VLTEIGHSFWLEKAGGRCRQQHLSAMTGSGDPGRSVHVHAEVGVVPDKRCTRVDSNPDADRTLGEAFLRRTGRFDRVRRGGECDEEPITRCIHLHTAVSAECFAKNPAMVLDHVAVGAVAELLEQPRRAFDVAEQERDRPGRKLARGHTSSVLVTAVEGEQAFAA